MPTHLYRHYSKDGRLLYIGVSNSALGRLAQHRQHSHWFGSIARCEIEEYETREAALAAEREAISKENPAHNITHRRDVAIERAESAKYLRKLKDESADFLMSQVVQVKVFYGIEDLPLPLRRGQIQRFMDEGKLGYFELPNARFTKMKRYVSGWQLIEFMEWLESRSKGEQK